jgi:diacylglycerol kinase (ATP)
LLDISRVEWLAITLAITAVWSSEAFNSAIESVCDAISSEHHPMIERAKDIAAAAVLLAAIGSALVGLIVFGPALLKLIRP